MKKRQVFASLFVGVAALLGILLHSTPAFAQQEAIWLPETKMVIGLEGIKGNKTGVLTVDKGTLVFKAGKEKSSIAVNTINDVVTGDDSQRALGGFAGTVTMAVPYGGGRFLSLFREKVDTVTIQYHDATGGLHGVIFTVTSGRADALKKELLDEGAKTSIPSAPADSKTEAPKQ